MAGSAPAAPTPARPPRALRGLLPLLADGALLLFVGALWACNAANAAAIAARWACGEDSGAAAAARTASFVAAVAAGVLAWLALPPVAWIVGTIVAEARREGHRAERSGAHLHRDGASIPVSVWIVIFLSIISLGLLIQELALAKGKGSGLQRRAGSVHSDITSFLGSVMACYVLLPNLISQPRFFTEV